jgi:guanylate kinase
VAGVDRLFLDPVEFDRLVASGRLLEWTRVGPHLRGTPREPVRSRLAVGQPVLLPLDLPGALAVRAAVPDARMVLLIPPGCAPEPPVAAAFDHVLTHDLTDRVADELVGLLGSSYLAPSQPQLRG